MDQLTFDTDHRIRTMSVVLVGIILSALALSLYLLIARIVPNLFRIPADLPLLTLSNLMLATIPAVLGNTLGFYLAYRSPHPHALRKFLIPAALFFVLFMLPHIWTLFTGGTLSAFALATLINTVPVGLAVSVFLSLRPKRTQTQNKRLVFNKSPQA